MEGTTNTRPAAERYAERPCETIADHDLRPVGGATVGKHPTMGPFRRTSQQCRRCGRVFAETIWLDPFYIGGRTLPNGGSGGRQ